MEAFREIISDIGVPVTIAGVVYNAAVNVGGLNINLEEGGFSEDGSLTIRMLAEDLPTPLPSQNSSITVGGDRYKVEEISRKPGSGVIEYRVSRR